MGETSRGPIGHSWGHLVTGTSSIPCTRNKMHLQWIFLFLMGSCWIGPTEETMGLLDLSSLTHFMVHEDHDIGSDTVIEKRLSRRKRDTTLLEYTADIEISFPDPSFANLIKQFLATNLTFPIMLGANDTQITSIQVTTACNQTGSNVQCSCQSGYKWPSAVCTSYSPCAGSSASSSDCSGNCIQGTSIPTQYCQPQPVSINLSLRINEVFTSDFTNPTSAKYIEYKEKLEAQLNKSYQSLPGFVSVTVTGFRPGSIVADYTLVTEPTSSTALTTANTNLVNNLLNLANISVDPSIKTIIAGQSIITVNLKNIFIKDNVVLTCSVNISSYSSVSWYFNSTQRIQDTSYTTSSTGNTTRSILTINGVSQSNGGKYTCIIEDIANSYQSEQTIVVQPLTFTVLNTNVACNSIPAPILQCCTQGSSTDFNLTCMGGTVGGVAVNRSPCWTYQLTIDPATCPSSTSKTYSCTCYTGNGANEKLDVNVIYQPTYVATVTSSVNSISEGKTLTMSCSCTATSVQSISWYLQNTLIPSDYYKNDLTACRSTLTIPDSILTVAWTGTYSCSVTKDSSNFVSPGRTITIARLIRSNQISTAPVGSLTYTSGQNITFQCCIGDTSTYPGAVLIMTTNSGSPSRTGMNKENSCFKYLYIATDRTKDFTAQCNITNSINDTVLSNIMSLKYLEAPQCRNPAGSIGSKYQVLCKDEDSTLTGTKTLICQQSGSETKWESVASESNCVSAVLVNFQNTLSTLTSPTSQAAVQDVLVNLTSTVTANQEIVTKPNNLEAVVKILGQAENVLVTVEKPVMENFLQTVNIVVANTTTWQQVENKTAASSNLLQSVERFTEKLVITGPVEIKNNTNIQLTGNIISNLTNDYNANFDFNQANNLTGNVLINKTTLSTFPSNTTVVSVAYATLKDILGSTNDTSSKEGVINGLVMTTTVKGYTNISIAMDFKKNNQSLNKTTCVFWNFNITDWDSTGCQPQFNNDSTMVSCACSHLTSFSVLMSTDIPLNPEIEKILTYITYFGLGISILSLVICIIIEATIWKSVTKNKTSYMRHLCIMNIAVTLLMADIWFIIGGAMSDSKKADACVAATFFTHVFYLCTFFWMLTMGLILFYRLMCVFHDLSKTVMMGISFFLGYGCPIIISVITVAVTQPRKIYTSDQACWLRVTESRAFLAFVVPALTILLVNFITLFVVIIKVLRPSVGDRPKKEEKSSLNHIAKCILILTPLLGLTWGLGIGTLFSNNEVVHGIFSALNALQGLSILLFGCLLDKKVRDALLSRFSVSRWSSQQTKSTNLSSSDPVFPKGGINLFGRKGVYNISNAQTSSSSEMSNSYSLLN
ncbi:adhesion G protein-coupled receptor F5 isoform X2 [Hyla sarda]|uniref:adhesion G protein-coupled receptor F5 isoform X2 n=1 Tax=Hyla sarda TaxID=327740 RepID=UPI0024C41D33|nr:adhesion G protein-coupled receptor F5 isoform X2 [Hyla sarda]